MLDALQVGLLLRLDQATVYQWVKQSKLPEPVRDGRGMLWHRLQIEQIAG
jgi:predicted DNA-binding transcriptional regulator AlpA